MAKKVKKKSNKGRSHNSRNRGEIEIVYTNVYSNSLPQIFNPENNECKEEEKSESGVDSPIALSSSKIIDTRSIINSNIEMDIINKIKEIAVNISASKLKN